MPASLRAHTSRATSSRPYDRRSPTASPAQSKTTYFFQSVPPASPIQATDLDVDADAGEDVPLDRPGLPTYAEYKRIEVAYLHSLSPRKRDKALITQAMFDKIWDVLHQPEACTIDTPQFRFWVRKMFTLSRPVGDAGADAGWVWNGGETGMRAVAHLLPDADSDVDEVDLQLERSLGVGTGSATADELFTAVVLHENRPVAVMEQLYELFCYCHVRAGHGGRDKTCAVIREHYSWVPKELTAQFVKACPTCVLKRSGYAVGVDIGVVGHKRVVGRDRKRGRAAPLEVQAEERSVPVGSLGWPTTGGPLDPGNPEPCGMREREREGEWLDVRGDVGGVCSPRSVPPVLGSRAWSMPSKVPLQSCPMGGWGAVSRASALDASSLHPCDMTRSYPNAKNIREEKENCSLPSLASALSDESLDGHVNLAVPVPGDATECLLPPALRPLRLSGPVPLDTEPNLAGPSPSHPFQIDPALLSLNHPGPGLSPEPGFVALSLRNDVLSEVHAGITSLPGHAPYRLRTSSDVSMNLPALEPSHELDSPDSSFERTAAYTAADGAATTLPFSLSTEFMTRSRCGLRYGYRDDPHTMLYHCSADEVDQEFDGPLSFSIIMDA